ncbi:MAG: hypothetical protein P4L79_10335 [Legionella sp.]|uniref:hypothetical protein n=1 Tax=Legionella sp. TaxID=459 RepID=UPI002842EEF4|nr:hypothetical protein [Legionella sp.]
MADFEFGKHFGEWKGVVVNRDDPLKSGRYQVRIMGVHDDNTQIPDAQLPWAHPNMSLTSASINHIGASPTGLVVGSNVHGYWADKDTTIPVILGTMPRAAVPTNKSPSNQPNPYSSYGEQAKTDPSNQNDVAYNARGVQSSGVQGETNFGKDFNSIIKNSHVQEALNAISHLNEALPFKIAKFPGVPTIGNVPFESGQKILNLIKQLDPNNLSGSIPGALSGIIGLKNLTDMASMMSGNGNLPSMFMNLIGKHDIAQSVASITSQLMTDPTTLPVSTANTSSNTSSNPQLQTAVTLIIGSLQQAFQNVPGAANNGQASFNYMQGTLKVLENNFNTMVQNIQSNKTS